MTTYYNEIDPYAAAWLRNLQEDGHIPVGRVDERSIVDVQPQDLEGVRQAHFFAGIGGWSLALRLAGWPEDREVFTGSCPCQPFSVAGKAGGVGDERHLWPAFHRLIAECRPPVCFGEQVESKDGRYWLAGVRDDLEREGYAVGAADLCAAGVGAPHRRQRLYWVAYAEDSERGPGELGTKEGTRTSEERGRGPTGGGTDRRMGEPIGTGLEGHAGNGDHRDEPGRLNALQARSTAEASGDGGMGNAERGRQQESSKPDSEEKQDSTHGNTSRTDADGSDFWNETRIIVCHEQDGPKLRRVPLKPSLFPVAPRVPGRVGLLRGAGGAIIPQVAAEFVRAYMEARAEIR